LFSFREIPVIIEALAKLGREPELVVCDGQGVAHPRRFGLASHLGVLLDVPTIGCAKTRLLGEALRAPKVRGDREPLVVGEEVVGSVLCTQDQVRPLYVSVGHRISLKTACDWVLKLSPKFRLPETTRTANETVSRLRGSTAPFSH
jgi:deoxyribonuclease V